MTAHLPPLTARGTLRWSVVERLLRDIAPRTVLELGCGQGGVGARIAQHASYTGVEPDESSYSVAQQRIEPLGGTVLHGDQSAVPAGSLFDVVCAFEVLEHLEDDAGVLATWVELVRPGGRVLFSVPEGPQRFGASDTMVGHFRRYTETTLTDLLRGAGLLDVRVRHYGWPMGYLLEAANNRLSQRQLDSGAVPGLGHAVESGADGVEARGRGSGRWLQPGAWAGTALRIATGPGRVSQALLPGHGPGLIAVARKR